ncbi:MAG: translation elongation factor Ts [Parachlamydiales bacterium]|jgi:elongation factor Ts
MAETITTKMLQELRDRTGVGMSKCKDALVRAGSNIDLAIEILRKEGMASAVKKEGRETREGFIGVKEKKEWIALVEVNAETDFVAKNESFVAFVDDLSEQLASLGRSIDLEGFLGLKFSADESVTVEQFRNLLVQKFGENIKIKRIELIRKEKHHSYGIYSHMGGKIVTVAALSGAEDESDLAKAVAMHVAAEAPDYLKPEDVPAEVVAKEEEIAKSQVKGKPENVIGKIVLGKVNAFYDQVCLSRQKYIKDTNSTVENFVKSAGDKNGKSLALAGFRYWKVGC